MKLLKTILLFLVIYTNVILADSPYVWEQVASVHQYFMSVENIDSLNLMALANRNYAYKYLYHSTDGGFTWDTIYKDLERIQYGTDLAYPTKDFIIFTADAGFENDAGIYVKSTDGGKSWIETRTNHYDSIFGYKDVRMFDDKHGVISGGFKMIVSHDGFETWDTVKLPEGSRIEKPEMISPYTIYSMVTSTIYGKQLFYKSKDGGLTWDIKPFPDSESEYVYIGNMRFIDSLFGYAIGWNKIGTGATKTDIIYRTTDGGESWKLVLDTLLRLPYGLVNLDILDRIHAIFVGQGGKIYWTHDGGNSFIHDSNANFKGKQPLTFYVSMLGVHTAITVDGDGRIFRSSLVTGVEEEEYEYEKNLFISPNPATDYIEISLDGVMLSETKEPVVKIYDVLGIEHPATAWHPSAEGNSVRIDISALAPGVYFVKVGERVSKFVKM